MDEERHAGSDRIEEMKRWFLAEREKYKYSLDDPVEPIRNKSGVGRLFFSVLCAMIMVAVCVVLISIAASSNAGQPFELPFFH